MSCRQMSLNYEDRPVSELYLPLIIISFSLVLLSPFYYLWVP